MEFEIDFNRKTDDKVLELLGAKLVDTDSTKYPPFVIYKIEVDGFEGLEQLLKKVDEFEKDMYSAVINFDPPTIFLDKDI